MGFAALHHPLQHGPFAEVLQLVEVPPEFTEALRVTFQALFQPPDSARGCRGVRHCSSCNNTVRIWQRQVSSPRTLHQQLSSSLCSSPGWPPPALSNCPSTRSRPNNRPKAARCNTVFGTVELVRMGYSRPGAPSIFPLDQALALPA